MKKFIAVVTLLFAFTISANAQGKKPTASVQNSSLSVEQKAQNDVDVLARKVEISAETKAELYEIMLAKQQKLSDPNLPASERVKLSAKLNKKMIDKLNVEQQKVVNSDSEYIKSLSQ